MRRRRRILALLFIVSAFLTPLGFFYYTIANESFRNEYDGDGSILQTSEVSEGPQKLTVDFRKFDENECSNFPPNIATDYPECLNKMNWLKKGWKTHRCYAENQIDGSQCSFRNYLSNIENYCPPMESTNEKRNLAKMSPSLRRLLPILEGVPHYMKTRIQQLWKNWRDGSREIVEKYPESMKNRRKLNILIFIGFLANEKKINFAKKSDHGGPLGELLQWSDLLASLSIIGHHLEFSADKTSLRSIVGVYTSRGPCQFVNGTRQQLDIIFTDIMGLNILRQHHRQFLATNRCRIRLLDSFGTHAEFATKPYFLQNKKTLSGPFSQRNPWGGHQLHLLQHWTFYPHSDDNTFLGFVVVGRENSESESEKVEPSALVYGKEHYMWKDAERPIEILNKFVKIHATVADLKTDINFNKTQEKMFDSIENHGFLTYPEISKLLDNTSIFFGLGFPLEGPAPLEAIAHGAVFINARFKTPKSRMNYRFLAEKPTLREWTSQNPYMEMIGEPHVVTVDIDDGPELEKAIKKALEMRPKPFVPFEFTPAGMLLRVALLLEKQEICDKIANSKKWPPLEDMKIFKTSIPGDSCEMTCRRQKMLCEPSYFPFINSSKLLKQKFDCESISSSSAPSAPFNCTLQSSASLFSCASRPESSNHFRICPCRTFLPENHAICEKCL